MKRLTKIIRVRITEEQANLLINKNVSNYIREALMVQLQKDFPRFFEVPF